MYFRMNFDAMPGGRHMADGMDKRYAIVRHQVVQLGEELVVVGHAHMLEHADGNDAVEGLGHLAVILQPELHTVRQTHLFGAFGGQFLLFGRQGDAHNLHVFHRRQIERHVAPATADIQHGLARFQVQLGGDQTQLVALGLFQQTRCRCESRHMNTACCRRERACRNHFPDRNGVRRCPAPRLVLFDCCLRRVIMVTLRIAFCSG